MIWQTGKAFLEKATTLTTGMQEKGIKAMAFIQRMDLAYAAADIVVSRAGASSISELALVAKPSILVPSPNVAEDHQTKNAMALVNKNAAILIKDAEAIQKLEGEVVELINNQTKQKELSANISKLAKNNSAQKIVEEIYQLIKN